MSADPLLQPFQLKHLRLKNRVMSTSHAISYQVDGKPKERYQLYHEEKAKGGLALTMFGGSSVVARDSPSVFGQLDVSDDSIVPDFQAFARRIHRHGCALMCQITHMGRRTTPYDGDWLPIVGPSRIREPQHRGFPKVIDQADITRIVGNFGAAAGRCKAGELDGCEVLVSGHLVGQFLSPFSNTRSDRFGGSIENRCRFALMVFEEIRNRVGDGYILGARMAIEEGGEDGLSFDDCRRIAEIFQASGTLDFLNLIHGRLDTELALAEHNMPGMAVGLAPFLDQVGAFRRGLDLPVFHAARITDVATARHALREGLVDMVGMTRAHIADPHIVRKILSGQEDRIRPCVGATYCNSPRRVCVHNGATGRERFLPHDIPRAKGPPRRVLVIGGGPAGLEAARVSALRGHEVVLHEATAELGGQVALAARASWRKDLRGIVDWLAGELKHLGVTVRLNSYLEPDAALAAEADIVVVATGGLPDLEWLEGWQLCASVWDILGGGAVAAGQEILVFDGTGMNAAASCADHLSVKGARVELVSPDNMLCQEVSYNDRVIQRKRLYELGVRYTLDRQIKSVERAGNQLRARLANCLTGEQEERIVDQVVVEHGTVPQDELFAALGAQSRNGGLIDMDALLAGEAQPQDANPDGRFALYRVGDAVASRDIPAAIHESFLSLI